MNEKEKAALFAALRPDDALVQSVKAQARAAGQTRRPLWRLTAAAAALLVIALAAVGVWQLRKPPVDPPDTTAQPVTVPVNPDGSMDYSSLASDGAMAPSIVKSGALSDITAFREEMVRRCDLCFEGTAIDVQYKHYDYRYYYGVKFGEETFIHEQPVTQLTTFRIEKVWHGDTTLVGTTITLEDESGGEDGTFGYRRDVGYVVLVQDLGNRNMWQPDDEEQYLAAGDVKRSSPYTTYYPWQPQVEIAKTGDYIVPLWWESMTADSKVKVRLSTETPYAGWSRYNYEMYADMLRLVKADVFRERMQTLLDESAAQPVTVPYNPDGSVNYSDLTSDGGAVPAMPQSGALLSVASFFESDVKGCTLCFEGTVTDVQFKQYDYRYYYGVKFGKETYIHEQPVTQLTTFRIEKVWHGDPSLVGTTVTLEDETIQDMGSVFGYRKGVCYVVLMQDVPDGKLTIWHPVGEERLVEGDITRSSPHATFYPWQPQVERAVTGDYIVPTTWKTVTEGCSVKVILEPDALQDSHTAHMLDWFGDQLRLVKADVFRARMAALTAE